MLNHHTILVTGASRGIGRKTVRLLLEQGAYVFANLRGTEQTESYISSFPEEHIKNLRVLEYDVTDVDAVKSAFAHIQKHTAQNQSALTGLVNNVGIMNDAALAMTRLDDLDQLFSINNKAVYQHCQLASRLMGRGNKGSIVNIGSQVAAQGSPGQSAYAMSKGAISGLTRSLAKELGQVGIRVNEVTPGFIDTDLTSKYSTERREQLASQTSLKRLGTTGDVANAIAFLLSDASSYITGHSLAVDGQIRF